MSTCKDCMYWSPNITPADFADHGGPLAAGRMCMCDHDKLCGCRRYEDGSSIDINNDCADSAIDGQPILTGGNFGCIHFEPTQETS